MMLLSLFLFFLLFFNTENFLLLCRESILLWYDKLLPTLFPAMIASNLILYHLQGKSKFEKYVIPIGFLAGFPMGSYLVGKLTKENKISELKGSWLLSFCNNIGPVFFINIFLQPVSDKNKITAFAIFYGIPLLYGLITSVHAYETKLPNILQKETFQFPEMLDYAISDAIRSIVKLCGYLIVFRSFLLIPEYVTQNTYQTLCFYGITEITSAVDFLQTNGFNENTYLILGLPILTLGGLCGIMQTECMLSGSSIKLKNYVFHKTLQAMMVFGASLLFFRF